MQRALIGLMVTAIWSSITGCERGAPAHTEPPPVSPEPSEPPGSAAPAPTPAPPPPPSPPATEAAPIPSEAAPVSSEAAPVASESPGRLDQVGSREDEPVKPRLAPNGNVTLGSVSVSGASVSDAALGVARMRAGFRSCYNRSLHDDPAQQGDLRLAIQVGPDGAVGGVEATPSGRLSEPLVSCVKARAHHGRFDVTGGDSATVTVPVTFARN